MNVHQLQALDHELFSIKLTLQELSRERKKHASAYVQEQEWLARAVAFNFDNNATCTRDPYADMETAASLAAFENQQRTLQQQLLALQRQQKACLSAIAEATREAREARDEAASIELV